MVIPPGRQGSEPKISLNYSSGGDNGWCGVGWNLDMGFIQRDTRKGIPIKWSATTPLHEYDDFKGFMFSFAGVNAALVNIGGNEYRAEVEGGWLKFTYVNPHWEVTDKSGNKFYFGSTADSRMDNPDAGWLPSAGKSTFRWGLNEAIDPNGNKTTLTYFHDAGQMYLASIAYNGNINAPVLTSSHTIEFDLGSGTRSDATISYKTGFRIETRKRLTEIKVKVANANIRRYVLQYAPSTLRSLLQSVTEFGADGVTSLPPLTFTYQIMPNEFKQTETWPGLSSQDHLGEAWNSIRARNGGAYVDFFDLDGDGLPDRVMRQSTGGAQAYFVAQRNNGSGFDTLNQTWGPFGGQFPNSDNWRSVRYPDPGQYLLVGFFDINADGLPDRIEADEPDYNQFLVQFNTGYAGSDTAFQTASAWGPVNTVPGVTWNYFRHIELHLFNLDSSACNAYLPRAVVGMFDINGDGFPDRVMAQRFYCSNPVNTTGLDVQLNSGSGFDPNIKLWPYPSQNGDYPGSIFWDWTQHALYPDDTTGRGGCMYDINGDGLPDRVWYAPGDGYFRVRFNTGAGFTDNYLWGPVESPYAGGGDYWPWQQAVVGYRDNAVIAGLYDMNGDGLLDRIIRRYSDPQNGWKVQFNTGSGFASMVDWTPIEKQAGTDNKWYAMEGSGSATTYVSLADINGDGLPDRVSRKASTSYDSFQVQLNKGPFPDLLSTINNGVGGQIQVSYTNSTIYDNRDRDWTGDPWTAGAKSLLPFPVYVVTSVTVSDGIVDNDPNNDQKTTYGYRGGMFDPVKREFRGFNCVSMTDAQGTTTTNYFHQGGGRDGRTKGEYLDAGSFAKKGIPYRVELWGNDNKLYKLTLNKVDEVPLHANGYCFPFISQTVEMDYEGLPNYRARAKQFVYDVTANDPNSTGNLIREANFGEVNNITINADGAVAMGGAGGDSDTFYTHTTYTNLANPTVPIRNRPHSVKHTVDEAAQLLMRESRFVYDLRGNLTHKLGWFNADIPGGRFGLLETSTYDQYGNQTNTIDAAGVQTGIAYDAARTFPVSRTLPWGMVSYETHDVSGNITYSKDIKGLVTENDYDTFFRPTETRISTVPNGPANLWKTKLQYSLDGIVNGISQNYVLTKVNDVTDANGHETYTYSDGLGRTIQTRAEADNGRYRAAYMKYDSRGKVWLDTQKYLDDGAAYVPPPSGLQENKPCTWVDHYDAIGRPYLTVTSGEPSHMSVRVFYKDGSNPWATVTQVQGTEKKEYRDAYGRTIQITEKIGSSSANTWYYFDLLGNPEFVVDHAQNWTYMIYDSMGRKTEMVDPDTGYWMYEYDDSGRLTHQFDQLNNAIVFEYGDHLGRISAKYFQSWDANLNQWVTVDGVSYWYDEPMDACCSVYPGQLAAVFDRSGWEYFGYDVRGRSLASLRQFDDSPAVYLTQTSYDDADRVYEITYPNNYAKIRYTYNTAGHVATASTIYGGGPESLASV